MTSPSKERSAALTKIELVSEAVEDLANAIVTARLLPARALKRQVDSATNGVVNARDSLNTALREFTAPMLRAIEGGVQPYAEGTAPVICGKCGSNLPACERAKRGECEHWAAAIRARVAS